MNRIARMLSVAVATAVFVGVSPVFGDDSCKSAETFELDPVNPEPGDGFGQAVDIDNGIVVVGSPFDSSAENDAGAVYVYDDATGELLFVLTAPDADPGDMFGADVAIGGDYIVVGAPGDDEANPDAGAVYIFDAMTGELLHKLLADDAEPGDAFGSAVDTDGDLVLIGAPKDDDLGDDSGSAYLFDPVTGDQILKLLPNDGEAGDEFGTAVALDGGQALVGAPHSDDNGPSSGSAYVFNTMTGDQTLKIVPQDGEAGDFFGSAVAIEDNLALIGAPGDDDNGSLSGSAYLFDATTGSQFHKLLPNDGDPRDQFGFAVDLSGDTSIIGAPYDEDGGALSGSVYLFENPGGTQIEKIVPGPGSSFGEFGLDVAIDGEDAVVGAQFNAGAEAAQSVGKAFLFDVCGGCLADIDGVPGGPDGTVNVIDLLDLLRDWGDPCTADCDGDLNADGAVGIDDLLCLLGAWGSCDGDGVASGK